MNHRIFCKIEKLGRNLFSRFKVGRIRWREAISWITLRRHTLESLDTVRRKEEEIGCDRERGTPLC